MTHPSTHTLFVGVDIAAASATVAWTTGTGAAAPPITIAQTPQGYTALQRTLLALGSTPSAILVVMEATGSYWMTLATTLAAAGLGIRMINPAQAHYFAKALLKRSKTDAIDAHLSPACDPVAADPVDATASHLS